MSSRSRMIAWGSTGALLVAGIVCAVLIGGETGAILAIVLIGCGFVLATSVVFFEIGLSEDREREQRRASPMRSDRAPRRRLQPRRRRRRP